MYSKTLMTGLVCATLGMLPHQGYAGHQHAAQSPSVLHIAPGLDVLDVEMGEHSVDAHGHHVFQPRKAFDMIPGRTYGWRMKLHTSRPQVSWQEIMTLPSKPAQWGTSSHVTLSADRRTATTTMTSSPDKDGYISNYWIFSEGDPTGYYTLNLQLEDKQVSTFQVKVR